MELINSNCDKTQKLKLYSNSKTPIVMNLIKKTQIVMKPKNSYCEETKNTQIVIKTQIVTNSKTQKLK